MILNNIKALGIHIFLVLLTMVALFVMNISWLICGIVCSIAYLALGCAVLKPVSKYEFLSITSVFFLLLFRVTWILYQGGGEELLSYIPYNAPGYLVVVCLLVLGLDYFALITAIVPSLLMYAGLRMKHKKIRYQQSKPERKKKL